MASLISTTRVLFVSILYFKLVILVRFHSQNVQFAQENKILKNSGSCFKMKSLHKWPIDHRHESPVNTMRSFSSKFHCSL